MSDKIDTTALHKVLAVYSAASREYGEAKRAHEEKLADLERQRKEARATLHQAYERYRVAGEALTRFTDDNPDPDDPESDEE